MSPARMCSRAASTARVVHVARRHRRRERRQLGRARSPAGATARTAAAAPARRSRDVEARARARRTRRTPRRRRRTGVEEHVLDEVQPLPEVVERGDVPGDRQHRVGHADGRRRARRAGARSRARRRSRGSRRRHRGTAAARRGRGARYAASSASSAASAPWSVGTPGGGVPSTLDRRCRAPTSVSAGSRPRNENRPQRSACSTDSSRNAGRPRRADELHERRHRRLEVGQHLAPHRHDRVVAGERDELVARRPDDGHRPAQTGPGVAPPRRHGRSSCARRCGTRRGPPAPPRRAARRRRSRSSASRTYWRSPDVSPLHQYSWRLRLQNHVRPVSSVRRSDSLVHPARASAPRRCPPPARSRRPGRRRCTAPPPALRSVAAIGVTAIGARPADGCRWRVPCGRSRRTRATPDAITRPDSSPPRDPAPESRRVRARLRSRPPRSDRLVHERRARRPVVLAARPRRPRGARLPRGRERATPRPRSRTPSGLQERALRRDRRTRPGDRRVGARCDAAPYEYFTRTVEGQQYGVHCRRSLALPRSPIRSRRRAPRRARSSCSTRTRSPRATTTSRSATSREPGPDARRVQRRHQRRRALRAALPRASDRPATDLDDVVPDVYYGVAWANDGRTVFYTRPDDAMRPWQVWRHALGTPRRTTCSCSRRTTTASTWRSTAPAAAASSSSRRRRRSPARCGCVDADDADG